MLARSFDQERIIFLPAVQLDDNLAGAVVINLLELSNVACEMR